MRALLASLYRACGWLAGLAMIGMLVCILLSILGRQFDFYIRGIDSYAGYCMAAAAFLALAHTFVEGDHIRVTLVLNRLNGSKRRALEIWCILLAIVISGALAFYSAKMVWWSHQFGDVSTANDATPLWIPQIGMALGAIVLTIAYIEEFVLVLLGETPRANSSEIAHTE